MTRSFLITALIFAAFLITSCSKSGEQETQHQAKAEPTATSTVDLNRAAVVYTASKITGDEHTGTLKLKSQSLTVENGKLTGGSLEVDMTSIVNLDIDSEKWNKKFVDHMHSDEFFNTAKFPVAKMEITKVEAGTAANSFNVTANFTIKDITHAHTFTVNSSSQDGKTILSAKLDIDRTKYDVKYGSNSFFEGLGDKAINDLFNLDIQVVL